MRDSFEKEYFTTGEIAKICHVNTTTIFRAIRDKQLKAATTPGGHFRVAKKDLEDFLRKNKIPYGVAESNEVRVLIVEDNPLEMTFFKRVLETQPGVTVKTTSSGYEAGFLTHSFRPHILLLDIYLPDMDGREVALLIQSDPKLERTRIVAVSGSQNPDDHRDFSSAKFAAVLQKPVSADELIKTVLSLAGAR